eukprot:365693-Chlamydomonas_euryale.AAC.22
MCAWPTVYAPSSFGGGYCTRTGRPGLTRRLLPSRSAPSPTCNPLPGTRSRRQPQSSYWKHLLDTQQGLSAVARSQSSTPSFPSIRTHRPGQCEPSSRKGNELWACDGQGNLALCANPPLKPILPHLHSQTRPARSQLREKKLQVGSQHDGVEAVIGHAADPRQPALKKPPEGPKRRGHPCDVAAVLRERSCQLCLDVSTWHLCVSVGRWVWGDGCGG